MPKNGAKEPPMVKLYLSEGEMGWAEDLGGGRYRIANIPMDGDYNIDDVVEARHDSEGFLQIRKLVDRVYHARTPIWYYSADQFPEIRKLVERAGGKAEGFMGPSPGHPGIMAVALPSEEDVIRIVEDLRLEQPDDWVPNEIG